MKALSLLSIAAMFVGAQAFAHTHDRHPAAKKSSPPAAESVSTADDSYVARKNILSPTIGFMGAGQNVMSDSDGAASFKLSGLLGIGFEYEYMLKDDFSIGGFTRYYQTTDSTNGTKETDSAFLLGPLVHAYLVNTSHWIAYVGTGFTILSLKQKTGDTTVSPDLALGLPIVVGVQYKINDELSAGIEHMQVMALGSDVNGWPISDFMLRLRIALAN